MRQDYKAKLVLTEQQYNQRIVSFNCRITIFLGAFETMARQIEIIAWWMPLNATDLYAVTQDYKRSEFGTLHTKCIVGCQCLFIFHLKNICGKAKKTNVLSHAKLL